MLIADRRLRLESFEARICLSGTWTGDFQVDHFVEPMAHEEVFVTAADTYDFAGPNRDRGGFGFTGVGQTVAIIDSGIAYDHEALGGGLGAGYRVVGGLDFTTERDADPYDDGPSGSHGTHVAGIIASNDSVYPGIAPGVDLVGLRVFDDTGTGKLEWVEEALQWIHIHRNDFENPITTVNLSLGTRSLTNVAADWSRFDDELAQLQADGIFVVMAAGNDFSGNQQAGLSRLAASPYVVPAASVDSDGNLSYFSQRDRRVIAAPGRGVLSTIPDYLGDRNGIGDDFARFSGTSMAAPYVAGAGVLLRQAYQFVGVANVSQDMIYNLMVSTADTVYDPITARNYHRLNLNRAIAAIMPADDFGSTRTTAYAIGTVVGSTSVTGMIASLDDSDWFRFTAGTSGTATLQLDVTDELVPKWELTGATRGATADDRVLTFDVVAGETYTFAVTTADGFGRYRLSVDLQAATHYVDWGTIRQNHFNGNRIDTAGQWFSLTAGRAGALTVEAIFGNAEGNVELELFDTFGNPLSSSRSTRDYERIDVSASAGETFYLRAYATAGANDEVDFRVTNLLERLGRTVEVSGTGGNDHFTFRKEATHWLVINEVLYQFDSATVDLILFDGRGGYDSAVLFGTAGDDSAVLRVGSVELSGPGYDVRATGVESTVVRAGGGFDRAELYDSVASDTFFADPNIATLYGPGFDNRAVSFEDVRAWATAGGYDVARLYDSAGNDLFVANAVGGRFFGNTFSNRARWFEEVDAYATSGGIDVARLFDSAGNDTFVATPNSGTLSGAGFKNRAQFFDGVHAYATAGGDDLARLWDSVGSDTLVVSSTSGALFGAGFYNRAKFFEQVHAHANSGGYDTAILRDSNVDDYFRASGSTARLFNNNVATWAYGFEYVRAIAEHGGTNRTEIAAVDYILELDGRWS